MTRIAAWWIALLLFKDIYNPFIAGVLGNRIAQWTWRVWTWRVWTWRVLELNFMTAKDIMPKVTAYSHVKAIGDRSMKEGEPGVKCKDWIRAVTPSTRVQSQSTHVGTGWWQWWLPLRGHQRRWGDKSGSGQGVQLWSAGDRAAQRPSTT